MSYLFVSIVGRYYRYNSFTLTGETRRAASSPSLIIIIIIIKYIEAFDWFAVRADCHRLRDSGLTCHAHAIIITIISNITTEYYYNIILYTQWYYYLYY